MAKQTRLTKKEVLGLFGRVDFLRDFQVTGETEATIKSLVSSYTDQLKATNDEAKERAIIDELTTKFGGFFADELAEIDQEVVNARFLRAQAAAGRDRAAALFDLFTVARQDYDEEQVTVGKKTVSRHDRADLNAQEYDRQKQNVAGANEAIDTIQKSQTEGLMAKDARLAELRAQLAELQAKLANAEAQVENARQTDKEDYYLRFEEEYRSSLGFIKRIGFSRKGRAEKAAILEAYVKERAAEAGSTRSDAGYIDLDSSNRYVIYENRRVTANPTRKSQTEDPLLGAVNDIIADIQEKIERTNADIEKVNAGIEEYTAQTSEDIAKQQRKREKAEEAAERAKAIVDEYNADLRRYDDNIQAVDGVRQELEAAISQVPYLDADGKYSATVRQMRLTIAQRIYAGLPEDTNPYVLLAYRGYISRLTEQERLAESFKTDADAQLEAMLRRDLNLNDPKYMEIAFEHYVAQGFGSSRYNLNLSGAKKAAAKYFGAYIPDVEKEFARVERKYTVAYNAMEFFAQDVLLREQSRNEATAEQKTALEAEVTAATTSINNRVAANRARMEIVNPNYDSLARYTNNPTVSRYMALTMIREQLVAKQKAGQALSSEEKEKLSLVSKELTATIETAKRDGSIIDLTSASQLAVETLIPGYDEISEYARVNNIDLTTKAGREALQAKEAEYRVHSIVESVSEEDLYAYAAMRGVDVTDAAKRNAFKAEHAADIAAFVTSGKLVVHHTIDKYAKMITDPTKRAQLENDPQAICDMYAAFGVEGLTVTQKDGKLYIQTADQEPVAVPASRLLDPTFMQSVGMVASIPQERAQAYNDNVPSIAQFLEERQRYVQGQTQEGQDLGYLGQATLFTDIERDVEFAEKREEVRSKHLTAKAVQERVEAIRKTGTTTAPYNWLTAKKLAQKQLITAYQEEYISIAAQYEQEREAVATAANNEELQAPAERRVSTDQQDRAEADRVYSEQIRQREEKLTTSVSEKKVRTVKVKALDESMTIAKVEKNVKNKVKAMTKAVEEFQDADPTAQEALVFATAKTIQNTLGYLTAQRANIGEEEFEAMMARMAPEREQDQEQDAVQPGISIEMVVEVTEDEQEVKKPAVVRTLEDGTVQTYTLGDDGKVSVAESTPTQDQGGQAQ